MSIPYFARISRATTLSYVEREFVLAAEAAGASRKRILVREVLPNVILPMLAFGLLVVAIAIVAEGSLAFLGHHRPEHDQLGRHDQRRTRPRCRSTGSPTPRCSPP